MRTTKVKGDGRRNKVVPAKRVEQERDIYRVAIDSPASGETIKSDQYTLRIGAIPEAHVEVALDGGLWQTCRRYQGYWWFDWSGYKSGRHEAVARLTAPNGEVQRGDDVDFLVELTE